MLTRTRPGWSIDSATPERWAASAAAASDWMALAPPMAEGVVSATSREGAAADPLRDDQAAGPRMRHVEHPSDAGVHDAAQLHCAGKYFSDLMVRQHSVGIDERERDLSIVRDVHRVPELKVRGSAVEDQQSVATACDGGTGNELHTVVL